MSSQRVLLAASIALNIGLGAWIVARSDKSSTPKAPDLTTGTPQGAPLGQAARLQPIESNGKSSPSAYEQNEIRNTLTKHATGPVQACFREVTAKDSTIQGGMVHVDWQILPTGPTTSVEIVSSNIPAMNACVLRVLSGLTFPPPPSDRPVYASHKFLFKKNDEAPDAGR